MQKKTLFNPRQTLVLAYLLAVVLWLVRCLAGSAVMLNYKMQGKMPQVTLAPDELTTESFAAYSSNEWWTAPDDDPNWYLSTDSDPHIYWQGQGYIETVELDAAHRLPPGGVALYYLKPGQTDYTEAQKVYAKVTAPGVYTFDLGGQWVTGLRIDPDSVGGVPTLFTGVTLNPDTPWYLRFIPAAGQLLALLFVPAFVAGVPTSEHSPSKLALRSFLKRRNRRNLQHNKAKIGISGICRGAHCAPANLAAVQTHAGKQCSPLQPFPPSLSPRHRNLPQTTKRYFVLKFFWFLFL